MARDWSGLEEKLKRLEEKKQQETAEKSVGEALFPEKPKKPPEKGAYTQYMEKVHSAYAQSSKQLTGLKGTSQSVGDPLQEPKLKKEEQLHFKGGMEKRFLKQR